MMKKFLLTALVILLILGVSITFTPAVYSREYLGTVLDFWAEWCGPCKQLDSYMNSWKAQYGELIKFRKIDVDDPNNAPLIDEYGVNAIPRVIVLDAGENVICDVTGFSQENINDIEAALASLASQIGEHQPSVKIRFPLQDAKVDERYINVEGSVSDDFDSLVSLTLILNKSLSFSLPAKKGKFFCTVGPLSDGHNVLVVEATDEAGYVGRASVSFYLESKIVFSDVREDYFAWPAIEELVKRGIISGYEDGTFRPNNLVTREEFTKILVAALNMPEVKPDVPTFTDVPADRWSYGFIESAVANNLMIGFPDKTFRPKSFLTNAQIATVICRQKGFLTSYKGKPSFEDLPEDHWAYQYIETLRSHGFSLDCLVSENRIYPDSDISRAKVCMLVYEMIK